MTEPVNPRIRRWLADGRATEAILGLGDCHVPSYTYAGEHDRVLVLGEALDWAVDQDRRNGVARAIEAAVASAAEQHDVAGVYDILWSYFLVSDDRRVVVPLNRAILSDALTSLPTSNLNSDTVARTLDRVRLLP